MYYSKSDAVNIQGKDITQVQIKGIERKISMLRTNNPNNRDYKNGNVEVIIPC